LPTAIDKVKIMAVVSMSRILANAVENIETANVRRVIAPDSVIRPSREPCHTGCLSGLNDVVCLP
jgi:hypothetical protein